MSTKSKINSDVPRNLEQLPSNSPAVPGSWDELGTAFPCEIGKRVALLREKLGFTQTRFSNSIGIHQNTLCNYENGKRTIDAWTILLISMVHGVSFEWLFFGEEPIFTHDPIPSFTSADHPRVRSAKFLPGRNPSALDAALLQKVINAVRTAASSFGKPLTSAQEAEIITGVYEIYRTLPPETPIPSTAIHHFLKVIK